MESHKTPLRIFAAALVFSPILSSAALISYESFSGYSGDILQNPAPAIGGFTGNWTRINGPAPAGGPVLASGSLSYSNPLYPASTGDSVSASTGNGRITRATTGPLLVTDTTVGTLYLSFLTSGGSHYKALELHSGGNDDPNRNFQLGVTNVPLGTANYFFSADNAGHTSTGVAVGPAVSLFVVRFDLSATAGQDSITVWGNPTLGGTGDPTGGITLSGLTLTWDRMALGDFSGEGPAQWDEIRWGTDFNSVTLIPEPSSALLIGSLGVLCLSHRRKG